MRRIIGVAVVVVVTSVVGCGGDVATKFSAGSERAYKTADRQKADIDGLKEKVARAPEGMQVGNGGEQKGENKQQPQQQAKRKIVYTGNIQLVVDNFDKSEEKLHAFIAEYDGYIANQEVTGEPNSPRRGTWTVRVPVARREEFHKAILRIGEVRRSTLDSRDITDQYYDTEAEVKNLEAREAALRELYKQKIVGSRLSELLEVDRELTNVRGHINVRKGQLQRWDKETSYTTYTISMYDRRGYIPPPSEDFGPTVSRTFFGSWGALVTFFQALVYIAVALVPWLIVIVPVGAVMWFVIRQLGRMTTGSPPPVPPRQGPPHVAELAE